MKILFLIRALENGGAERQLALLANELARRGHAVAIAVFYAGGVHEKSLDRVRLVDLAKGSRWNLLKFAVRLLRTVASEKPDVLHGYLSSGNLGATLGHLVAPKAKLVWGIRDSEMDFRDYGRTTSFVYRMAQLASRRAHLMIFNSTSGHRYWKAQGHVTKPSVCIPNGIDVDKFVPDASAGGAIREDWGIPADVPLIGMVGRLDPAKGHSDFLKAAALVCDRAPAAHFVCIGGGPDGYKIRMQALAGELGIAHRVLWPGPTQTMPAVYNALDVFCLASTTEGFPNVVAEAMACGKSCVVTDVGDAAWLVGDAGRVVPHRDPAALARAILEALADRNSRSESIRQRITNSFTVKALTDRTEDALAMGASLSVEHSRQFLTNIGSHVRIYSDRP